MLTTPSFAIDPLGATLFGAGTIDRLPELIADLECRRVFVVTDQGVVSAGVSQRVQQVLLGANIESVTFDDVRPNPGTDHLESGGRAIRAFGTGVVVAVGGGAVLDVAKGLALMAVNPGPARDFEYSRDFEREGLPLIAVPTTSGTGSETNAWGVIDDHQAGRKFYIGHRSVTPRFVILDPELTVGLPPGPTAAAGMDALTHALESLSSRRANPYARALNVQVVQMVAEFLPRAVADGADVEARAQMLLAAHLAGRAFGTTGLGIAHALGHALSARIGAAHGTVLAILLPHVLAFNLPVCEEMYARLASLLDLDTPEMDQSERARALISFVRSFSSGVGIPGSLRALGCSDDYLDIITDDALSDEVLANTPREPSRDDMIALLQAAMRE